MLQLAPQGRVPRREFEAGQTVNAAQVALVPEDSRVATVEIEWTVKPTSARIPVGLEVSELEVVHQLAGAKLGSSAFVTQVKTSVLAAERVVRPVPLAILAVKKSAQNGPVLD